MAITIGLDFGTHQTKICIENSDVPLHKTYEFLEWEEGVYALPSVVQINLDHTLRYGSIDMATCLHTEVVLQERSPQHVALPPQPKKPDLPNLRAPYLPPMPIHVYRDKDGNLQEVPFNKLYRIGKPLVYPKDAIDPLTKWERKCRALKHRYEERLEQWKNSYDWIWDGKRSPQPKEPFYPKKPTQAQVQAFYDSLIDPQLVATDVQIEQYKVWKESCECRRYAFGKAVDKRKKQLAEYERVLCEWEEECQRIQQLNANASQKGNPGKQRCPCIYRYFKQATFASYQGEWIISPNQLTVLYLAYIIFKLEKRFGTNFSIQMGVPASENTFADLKQYAAGYLIQAYRLVEEIFANDLDRFLATTYEELVALIPEFEYSEELKKEYGIIILPEAYAALRSVTVNSRIPEGMNLMLDIGGGTTDISFFVIEKGGEPHIYHFESISKGLNFFLEYEERSKFGFAEMNRERKLEDISIKIFTQAQTEYSDELDNTVQRLTSFLHTDSIARGFSRSNFSKAIMNRPVIYTGGGSTDDRMRRNIREFTDVKFLNKKILSIPNVVKESSITIPYSLLATAFGLSIQRVHDNVEVSKKEELFADYSSHRSCEDHWSVHREHGMWE